MTDSAGLTDVQDITVSVTDEVENTAPTIISAATASVPENQTSAIDVESSDDTDSEGSGLTYSLTGGADAALFSIDADNGVVTFNAAPDFEAPSDANGDNDFEFQVTVTDSAGLTDVQDLSVTVTDLIENTPPTITTSDAVSVAENQTAVIDINATDDNDSEGAGLTYSLTGGADQALFTLDSDTGVLTFSNPPDFENPGDANGDNVYLTQVTVTDSDGLTDVQDLSVTVTDEPEDEPLTLIGTFRQDTLTGGNNDDLIKGRAGADTIIGNGGQDTIFGGFGSDDISGDQGDDLIYGGFGSDNISGGQGNDRIFGNLGRDFIRGDQGNDILTGGLGPDTFVLAEGEGTDTITDFRTNTNFGLNDLIGLAGGLTFNDLERSGNDISVIASGEILVTINGVDTSTLDESYFIDV